MNADKIIDAMGGVRDKFVQDAEKPVPRRNTVRRLVALAVAATLCLALAVPVAASPALRG